MPDPSVIRDKGYICEALGEIYMEFCYDNDKEILVTFGNIDQ